jgi:hypothetical protein
MKGSAQWCHGTRSSSPTELITTTTTTVTLVGLGLQVLSSVTHSLSDYPIFSIFFLGGVYPFFHAVDTAVPVLASSCLPFRVRVEAGIVGSVWLACRIVLIRFVPN